MEYELMAGGGSRGRPPGMTVIELTIAVSILGILSAIAIPGIVGGVQRSGVDGASRRLAEDVRLAQSHALTRGAQTRVVAFDQSGAAPNLPGTGTLSDTTKGNMYRIELRSGASASWPALTDTPATNSNVLTVWQDLASQYRGVAVTTGNTVVFNSLGGLLNTTTPVNIVLQGSGGTKTIQTSLIGKATIS